MRLVKRLFKTPERLIIGSGVLLLAAILPLFWFGTRLARWHAEASYGQAFHLDSYADGEAIGWLSMATVCGLMVVWEGATFRLACRLWPEESP